MNCQCTMDHEDHLSSNLAEIEPHTEKPRNQVILPGNFKVHQFESSYDYSISRLIRPNKNEKIKEENKSGINRLNPNSENTNKNITLRLPISSSTSDFISIFMSCKMKITVYNNFIKSRLLIMTESYINIVQKLAIHYENLKLS
ncbi:hypothetical protein L9F63_023199, partial [Diploptera punctata]